MDFLAKTLGSLSFSSSAFSRGALIEPDPTYPTIWRMYEGTVRKDKRPCTIFEFDGSVRNSDHYRPLAQNALSMLRKMRLPGLLKIIDSEEVGGNIVIAVEPVKPLYLCLSEMGPSTRLWGLQTLYNTLAALHTHVKCVHGNINLSTVFETDTGEWVLGGFEIAAISENDAPVSLTNGGMLPAAAAAVVASTGSKTNWLPTEVVRNGWGSLGRSVILVDSYEYGYLAGKVLRASAADGTTPKTPQAVVSFVQSLTGSQRKPIADPAAASVLKTPIAEISELLSSLMMMNEYDMLKLLRFVDAHRDELPKRYIGGCVLPQLIQVTSNGKGGAEAVFIMLRLCLRIDEDQFLKTGLIFVLKMFKSIDRAVRIELLKVLPSFIDMIPKSDIQQHILPAMATGFADQEMLVRQESLRVVPILAKRITSGQLEHQLLRSLARINTDREPSIRAQFIRLLAEIAEFMTPATRSSVVVMALARAVGDPACEVRVAAIETLGATVDTFGPVESTKKLLGPAASAMLDEAPRVRAIARKIVERLVKKVEQASLELDKNGVTGPEVEEVHQDPLPKQGLPHGSASLKPYTSTYHSPSPQPQYTSEVADFRSDFDKRRDSHESSIEWDAWADPVPVTAPQVKPLKPTDARILQPTRVTPIQINIQPRPAGVTRTAPPAPPKKSSTPNFLDDVEDDDDAAWEW